MRTLSVSNDIVPIAEFKTNISSWFKKLQHADHPLIITQNSKPAGVLLSPGDYDALVYRKSLLDSVDRGIEDMTAGRLSSTVELKAEFKRRRATP